MAQLDKLFNRWLDGEPLSEQQLSSLEHAPEYAEMMRQAQHWQKQAAEYRDEAVPHWPKESLFPAPQKTVSLQNWWQSGLIAASVLIGFVFYGQHTAAESDLLRQEIARQSEVLNRQQAELSQMRDILGERSDYQQQKMMALAKDVIATGRLERKQDIASLVKYMNAQRAQDQALWRLQLNDLAEQVEEQGTPALARNSEY